MAGDTKETAIDATLPTPLEYDDPLPSMLDALRQIAKAMQGIVRGGETEIPFDGSASGAMQAGDTWARLRVAALVFSTSAAAVVTLTTGTRTRTFVTGGAGTVAVPLPIIIERGLDVTLTTSAGTVTGYLVATPE